ncbi:hypothetical protein [Alkalibacter saccharofermentans]|uniref:Uncharacterized protein n=1 Tax=Alkalibacter saccharofermentans DSM 14828 TaxID=1120975 RepID=A0A1M4ZC34_9FIRM|nr:hypothetical protein [Alkalibacter saccharofermentans]SHF15613.1 hypothetical protein SAMN02746064_02011 [Alkalibacter saccharofermentans DSM 14828]
MEELLGPLIAFIFIVGSSILQNRNRNKHKTAQKKPTLTNVLTDQIERMNQMGQQNTYRDTQDFDEEEQTSRDDQIESLKAELRGDSDRENKELKNRSYEFSRTFDQNKKTSTPRAKASKKFTLKNKLNNTGLRQSIVMAEVLGQPRSKKPHSQTRH